MKLHAQHADGKYYSAQVVAISKAAKRGKAPVKVSYEGYTGYEEWVGGDRIRSKSLSLVTEWQ